MSFYGILVLIHILGAICGIGASICTTIYIEKPQNSKASRVCPSC